MKIKKLAKTKQPKKLIEHMVQSHGTARHKKAYRSIVQNIIGLTRKVQSVQDKLNNAEQEKARLSHELAEERKHRMYGSEPGTTLGIGDGTGSLFVKGDYDSIKAAQAICIRDSENRIAAYKLASHIASSKGGLPAAWQDWAEEIESDLRKMANV